MLYHKEYYFVAMRTQILVHTLMVLNSLKNVLIITSFEVYFY
jgi:hypothetical protein